MRAPTPFFCKSIGLLIGLRKRHCSDPAPLSQSLAPEEDFLLSSGGGTPFLFNLDALLHCPLTEEARVLPHNFTEECRPRGCTLDSGTLMPRSLFLPVANQNHFIKEGRGCLAPLSVSFLAVRKWHRALPSDL